MRQSTKQLLTFVIIIGLLLGSVSIGQRSRKTTTPTRPNNDSEEVQKQTPPTSTPADSKKSSPKPSVPSKPTNPKKVAEVTEARTATVDQKAQTIVGKDGRVYPLRVYKPLMVPNDTYATQWWTTSNNMSRVWDIPAGAKQTKIAIIDTGFALNHQEFSGRWAINPGETGALATNGIDDDNNGFIDDWRGWDFTSNTNNVQAGKTNPNGTGTTHGTMTAGVMGATGNNGVGISGVNWYSTILPIQALDDDSYGTSYTVGQSIYYAADQGADVISISLGTASDDPYLRQAMLYAFDKGAVIVAASGNDGCNCISYPANYPEVIAVGAIDSTGNPASFSNYGANLDLLAPGASMTVPYWTNANQTSSYASGAAGTSFATPFVAGLLGLARAQQPNATWDALVGSLLENSDRRVATASTPRNDTFGYGVARASTMLDRTVLPNSSTIRYQLAGLGGSAYQCETTLPATPVFELTNGTSVKYTLSQLERYRASLSGWTSRQIFYSCSGLPTDTIGFLRTLNLSMEIRNINSK